MLYEPTLESVRAHQAPDWFHDAKLGIFIHWGLYSVPAWAPHGGDIGEVFQSGDMSQWFRHNSYAEWYMEHAALSRQSDARLAQPALWRQL